MSDFAAITIDDLRKRELEKATKEAADIMLAINKAMRWTEHDVNFYQSEDDDFQSLTICFDDDGPEFRMECGEGYEYPTFNLENVRKFLADIPIEKFRKAHSDN